MRARKMPRRSKTTGTNSESPRPSSPSSIGLITLSARPNTRGRFLSRCSCCRNLGRRRRACCRRTGRKGLGRAQTQLFLNLSFQNAIKCKSLCQMSIQFNRMHRSLYYAYGLQYSSISPGSKSAAGLFGFLLPFLSLASSSSSEYSSWASGSASVHFWASSSAF